MFHVGPVTIVIIGHCTSPYIPLTVDPNSSFHPPASGYNYSFHDQWLRRNHASASFAAAEANPLIMSDPLLPEPSNIPPYNTSYFGTSEEEISLQQHVEADGVRRFPPPQRYDQENADSFLRRSPASSQW